MCIYKKNLHAYVHVWCEIFVKIPAAAAPVTALTRVINQYSNISTTVKQRFIDCFVFDFFVLLRFCCHRSCMPRNRVTLRIWLQLWRNCLRFWECCQEYHKLFYLEIINKPQFERRAKVRQLECIILALLLPVL